MEKAWWECSAHEISLSQGFLHVAVWPCMWGSKCRCAVCIPLLLALSLLDGLCAVPSCTRCSYLGCWSEPPIYMAGRYFPLPGYLGPFLPEQLLFSQPCSWAVFSRNLCISRKVSFCKTCGHCLKIRMLLGFVFFHLPFSFSLLQGKDFWSEADRDELFYLWICHGTG